ncbi:MAG: NAD-dependent aldehyde dehydrogenase [Planctomycetaceae bacterium]|nr:NAD-dependent aldehyde dehydrogenase [Planctomycetaceae bacterium]
MFTDVLSRLGLSEINPGAFARDWLKCHGPELVSLNPATGQPLGKVVTATHDEYETVIRTASESFLKWRLLPPPQRGEIIRQIGMSLRQHKADLGLLVTLETGKILTEGQGEVQEMIDMCDYAVGLSRQLFGLTMASERPSHRMFEQWHPLGPVGIITAFNFPVAVWAWNAAVAGVCGDSCVWKPSSNTPLTAIAVQQITNQVLKQHDLNGCFTLCIGSGSTIGQWLAEDRRLPLISATGSCHMGRRLAQTVAGRLGRSLLELGGNNGIIVTETANLELALRAVTFAAVGTAGQRCTSLRRLFLQQSIADEFLERLVAIYGQIRIGNPWDANVLLGPLISEQAVADMLHAMATAEGQGGKVLTGGHRLNRPGNFVEPTIIRATSGMSIVREETFAPILYVMTYEDLDQVIQIHNSVDQGLSSAIFTDRLMDAEKFLSPAGSDCGIANVNIGTSGAEIGGAFGGEKETGGGREAGSDSWKAYMRRQTCTINYGSDLPLAQGVTFDVN